MSRARAHIRAHWIALRHLWRWALFRDDRADAAMRRRAMRRWVAEYARLRGWRATP